VRPAIGSRLVTPQKFLKVAASLVPREWHVKNAGVFEDMTEDDLARALAQVRSLIAAGIGAETPSDAAPQEGKPKLN
jgi:hypothetical protein